MLPYKNFDIHHQHPYINGINPKKQIRKTGMDPYDNWKMIETKHILSMQHTEVEACVYGKCSNGLRSPNKNTKREPLAPKHVKESFVYVKDVDFQE